MGQALTNPSFDQFIAHVFDHPVTEPQWYWEEDADEWAGPPDLAADYLARLFGSADTHLARFSDAQVNQGLFFAIDDGSSVIVRDIIDSASPTRRSKFLQSIPALYEKCFAKRCSHHLSHRDEREAARLISVCYMWWDLFPTWGDSSQRERDAEILAVMSEVLVIDHDACRESAALHGLGHWQLEYPDFVQSRVQDFLTKSPGIRPELKRYALEAAKGRVL